MIKDKGLAALADRMHMLIQIRATVPREELIYLVEHVEKLKDERLKAAVAALVGWDDQERDELETFVAISIEVLKGVNPSRIAAAERTVQLRALAKQLTRRN